MLANECVISYWTSDSSSWVDRSIAIAKLVSSSTCVDEAVALMVKPSLLLLDEPSLGLAPLITEESFAIIHQLARSGTTILLVEQNAEKLGEIETTDSGKLAHETVAQTRYVGDYYRYFAGLADKIEGATLPIDKPDILAANRLVSSRLLYLGTPRCF